MSSHTRHFPNVAHLSATCSGENSNVSGRREEHFGAGGEIVNDKTESNWEFKKISECHQSRLQVRIMLQNQIVRAAQVTLLVK